MKEMSLISTEGAEKWSSGSFLPWCVVFGIRGFVFFVIPEKQKVSIGVADEISATSFTQKTARLSRRYSKTITKRPIKSSASSQLTQLGDANTAWEPILNIELQISQWLYGKSIKISKK